MRMFVEVLALRGFAWGLALSGLAALVGCGGSDSLAIQGDVTLDGQPVGPGSIAFYPADGSAGAGVSAAIENGRYEIPAERGPAPGSYRVQISWPKKTGKQIPSLDPGFTTDQTVEAIPPKYNTDSTLKVSVTPGEPKHDFTLTSK